MMIFSTNNISQRLYDAGDADAHCMVALYKAAWRLEVASEDVSLDLSEQTCNAMLDALETARKTYKLATGKDLPLD